MEQRKPAAAGLNRWEGHPRLALTVRLGAWLTPIFASTATVFVASRAVPRPTTPLASVGWWAALLALGTLMMFGTERVARRLLPLAALLKLSLAFPDAAPSRFGVALRAGSLRHRTRSAATTPPAFDTPSEATATLAALVAQLHDHDRRTRGHTERVRAYAVLLGEELRLPPEDLDKLQWAAMLHDIGKIKVPTEILNKAGKLDDDEFGIIKTHPGEGAKLVEPLRWWLGEWTDAVGQHHEKMDGSGYPLHLAGTDISYAGRIVAVADAYDVMTAARSYKKPLDASVARTELTRCAGTHFDPVVVRAFLSISIGRLEKTTGPLTWLANIPVIGTAPLVNAAAAVAVGTAAILAGNPIATDTSSQVEYAADQPVDASSASTLLPAGDRATTSLGDNGGPGTGAGSPPSIGRTDPTPSTTPTSGPAPTTSAPSEQPTTSLTATPEGKTPEDPPPSTTEPTTTTTTTTIATTTTSPPPLVQDISGPTPVYVPNVYLGGAGSTQVALLSASGASSLLYVACDDGDVAFSGTSDPVTIEPLGAASPYVCNFQADRADGVTVEGTFTVYP